MLKKRAEKEISKSTTLICAGIPSLAFISSTTDSRGNLVVNKILVKQNR